MTLLHVSNVEVLVHACRVHASMVTMAPRRVRRRRPPHDHNYTGYGFWPAENRGKFENLQLIHIFYFYTWAKNIE